MGCRISVKSMSEQNLSMEQSSRMIEYTGEIERLLADLQLSNEHSVTIERTRGSIILEILVNLSKLTSASNSRWSRILTRRPMVTSRAKLVLFRAKLEQTNNFKSICEGVVMEGLKCEGRDENNDFIYRMRKLISIGLNIASIMDECEGLY
jgi:hypothetical protein